MPANTTSNYGRFLDQLYKRVGDTIHCSGPLAERKNFQIDWSCKGLEAPSGNRFLVFKDANFDDIDSDDYSQDHKFNVYRGPFLHLQNRPDEPDVENAVSPRLLQVTNQWRFQEKQPRKGMFSIETTLIFYDDLVQIGYFSTQRISGHVGLARYDIPNALRGALVTPDSNNVALVVDSKLFATKPAKLNGKIPSDVWQYFNLTSEAMPDIPVPEKDSLDRRLEEIHRFDFMKAEVREGDLRALWRANLEGERVLVYNEQTRKILAIQPLKIIGDDEATALRSDCSDLAEEMEERVGEEAQYALERALKGHKS